MKKNETIYVTLYNSNIIVVIVNKILSTCCFVMSSHIIFDRYSEKLTSNVSSWIVITNIYVLHLSLDNTCIIYAFIINWYCYQWVNYIFRDGISND